MMIKEMPDITEPVGVFGFSTAKELVNQTLNNQQITKSYSAHEEPNLPSGFENIDNITKGFTKGELITIASRPGNGKTAFLLSLVHNMAMVLGYRVALFSPERNAVKVINRLIESNTSHSVDQIRSGHLKEGEKAHAIARIQQIASANLFIDDRPTLDNKELLLRCHQVKSRHHADIILIDAPESYTAHIGDQERRAAETEELYKTLHHLAKDLDIPVICFSQISRPVSVNNGGFLPSLNEVPAWVAENSATVIFIHRPEYYGEKSDALPRGHIELVIDKLNHTILRRNTYLKFIESIDRFANPE